jgi:hypothetical protein
MSADLLFPDDPSQLLWHVDPESKRYRTPQTALRACRWLNAAPGPHEVWEWRPGPSDGSRTLLERRWQGLALALIDLGALDDED